MSSNNEIKKCQINSPENKEKGATMLEYALLASLIAVVCIAAVTLLGQKACQSFSKVASSLSTTN